MVVAMVAVAQSGRYQYRLRQSASARTGREGFNKKTLTLTVNAQLAKSPGQVSIARGDRYAISPSSSCV